MTTIRNSEITERERVLCSIGRRIMDIGTAETDCELGNKICSIGSELTAAGAPEGKPVSEFTIEEMSFIFKIIKEHPEVFPEFIKD